MAGHNQPQWSPPQAPFKWMGRVPGHSKSSSAALVHLTGLRTGEFPDVLCPLCLLQSGLYLNSATEYLK